MAGRPQHSVVCRTEWRQIEGVQDEFLSFNLKASS